MNAIVPVSNAEVYRASTDAAGLCRDIVLKTAMTIQGRKYVKVEGWQSIAIAHGCVASSEDVSRVEDEGLAGYRAMGVIRRMSDGAEIARAEGFLGDDETMWTKRPVYARRAMVQTRAISRACRSAFAHVVVLIDSNLSTTPAEEVPDGGFEDRPAPRDVTPRRELSRNMDDGTQAKAPTTFAKAIDTPLEAFIAAMKMNKTVEKVDAWAVREANSIAEKLRKPDQNKLQAAYEEWRDELAARVGDEAEAVFS